MLWLYDLPDWLFCVVVVGTFVVFALAGQWGVRRYLLRWYGGKEYNDIVGQFLSASGVFFGITLGLLSAGAWEDYAAVDDAVTAEATAVGVLYRVVDNFPDPYRGELTCQLRDYTRREIDVSWPLQQKGEDPSAVGHAALTLFYQYLNDVEPQTEAQKIVQGEAVRQFGHLIEARRLRIASVSMQLPGIIWFVVMVGSVLNLSLMWLFVVEHKRLHDVLTTILACLLGLLVFLLAEMDFPFRGEFCVGPDAFEAVYQQLMLPLSP